MNNEVKYLYLDDIIPNRFQPRENFDEQALKELAVSIKEHGVIQPIIVRQIGEKYEIIAGERRYKAATMAGLTKIPALVNNLDDKESSKIALIENLQRKDLTPIEEARTYQKILDIDALTQEDLARTMGKSQSAVSNKLRLLTLPEEVQDALLHEQISERHARSLLNVQSPEKQVELLNKVISSRMTVRELDQEIKNLGSEPMMNNNINNNLNPTDNMNNNMNDNMSNGPYNSMPNSNPMYQGNGFVNPTTVDIDRMKNESVDISMNQPLDMNQPPQMSTDSLLMPEGNGNFNNQDSQMYNNPATNEEPIGGNGLLAGIPVQDTMMPQDNMNNGPVGFENNLNNNFEQNNNPMMDSDMMQNNLMMDTPPSMNMNNQMPNIPNENNFGINNNQPGVEATVEKIKNSINTIRNEGRKIEMEDFDFDDFYQIVIRVDKQ